MTMASCQDPVTFNLAPSNKSNSVFESGKISFYGVDKTPKRQRRRSSDLSDIIGSTTLSRRLLSSGVIIGILIGLSHHFQHTSSLGSLRRSLRSVVLQQSAVPEVVYAHHSDELELTLLKRAQSSFYPEEKLESVKKSNNDKNRPRAIEEETPKQARGQLRKNLPVEAD